LSLEAGFTGFYAGTSEKRLKTLENQTLDTKFFFDVSYYSNKHGKNIPKGTLLI